MKSPFGIAIILGAVISLSKTSGGNDPVDYPIPPYFKLGAATAAFQIEGAWNEDGKGPSIWDTLYHEIGNNEADTACDSYHKYLEDVEMLKYLKVHHYRFSISWPRLLPTGSTEKINQAGVDYYTNLITALRNNGIEPMITLYHWDLPQTIQDNGGWLNESIVDHFAEYARLVFNTFGTDVKYWFTFNEPKDFCWLGYGVGLFAPNIQHPGIGDYQCAHNVLKAHARAYHIYDNEFRKQQNGQISIVLNLDWPEPGSASPSDKEAAERTLQFRLGLYANPIYHPDGNYPQVMIDRIRHRSLLQGFNSSRLPEFTDEEIDYIRGTADFFSLNYYSASNITWDEDYPIDSISFSADLSVKSDQIENVNVTGIGWSIMPEGLRTLVNWIHNNYNRPEIFITENGYGTLLEDLSDENRILYLKAHVSALLQAIYEDGVNVTGYTAWSLMDNLEWITGSLPKFGLYHVDFKSPNKTRTIKDSGEYYKTVIETRCLGSECQKL